MIGTVTAARRGLLTRTAGSSTPTVTVSWTRSRAPSTETGSVSASVARLTALSGPMTSTLSGSTRALPATYPGAGRPSTDGSIGRVRDAEASNASATVAGVTCTISMPNGARTWSGVT